METARPLRLWPGVAAAALLLAITFLVPLVFAEAELVSFLGGAVFGLLILLWWAFFSRVPHLERWGLILLMVAGMLVTARLVDPSIRGAGMGYMLWILSIPVLGLATVAGAVLSRNLAAGRRRAVMALLVLLACAGWTLVRTGGITGEGDSDLGWRWAQTPEQRLLAEAGADPLAPPAGGQAAGAAGAAEWPGFRGPDRDGVVREAGVRLETDWSKSPPVQVWRRPVGPGWSSFAVSGDLLYTQEQRGEDEVVACYRLSTGEPVWVHRDAARFYESNAGAGPRATPTLDGGQLFTLGGTGIVNALDAGTGAVLWTRDAKKDTGGNTPYWGFASSPLVIEDSVVVYAGGLAAYDRATGAPRWVGTATGVSYSSPHHATLDGVPQILQPTKTGVSGVAPADGKLLWENTWEGVTMVQPALTPDGDVLFATSGTGGIGTRRLDVLQGPGGWTVQERWTSNGLKPYFNDFVVHEGHAYGFDNRILACIDLNEGERKWKGGRYGHGQLVLLPEQDLLVVISEAGELALVRATPEQFTELGRFAAIEGKTWNHPVVIGDLLLARNSQEMAAFRLPLAR